MSYLVSQSFLYGTVCVLIVSVNHLLIFFRLPPSNCHRHANNGMDYDALVKETAPSLATSESMVGISRKHDTVNQEGTEQDNSTGGDYGRGDYQNYDNGGGNNDYEDGEDYGNGEDYGYEDYEDYNNGYGDDYEYEDDDDYGRY